MPRHLTKFMESTGATSLRAVAKLELAPAMQDAWMGECPMLYGRPLPRWTRYGRWEEDGTLTCSRSLAYAIARIPAWT